MRAIKRQMDGALGSRGAWLLEPYSDKPDSVGLNTTPVADIDGDRAAGDGERLPALRACDRRSRQPRDAEHLRARIQGESRQDGICGGGSSTRSTSAPADIPRFGQLGVIASMQGIHCTSDAPYVLDRLGARRAEEGAYVWQKLMKSGAIVSNGTDAPVEDVDPIAELLRDGDAQDEGRHGVLPRSAHEPDGGAEVVHAQRRVRGVPGRHRADRSRSGSSRT